MTGKIPADHIDIRNSTKTLFEISDDRNVAVKIEEPNSTGEGTKYRKPNCKKVQVREPKSVDELFVKTAHGISWWALGQTVLV